jgi:glycosyltransferase involved in cell wall biosynthesis
MRSPSGPGESRLRVLYVIDSLTRGGAETSLAAMAPGLVGRGVDVDVVALKSRPGIQDAVQSTGATVTELTGSRRNWWRQIQTIVRERQPDLVHTTLFEADLAGRIGARLAGTPVVSTLANDAYGPAHFAEFPNNRAKLLAAQLADAATARLATQLHAISFHVADIMAPRLRYPRDRIHVIPRGRDPETLGRRAPERRDRTRDKLGIAPGVPMVLALARQERQKGLDVLIDAFPRVLLEVPAARFMVAGQPGNATNALERQLARTEHADAFTFLGARGDVADLLCAADLFVLPSRREGLGGALLEAMALECPVVVSDIPPLREVVDDESALFVPADDASALAAAVVSGLIDPERSRERAQSAYERFLAGFTINGIVGRTIEFYRGAIDDH